MVGAVGEQIDSQPDHQLFLFRSRGGDQQSQGDKPLVVEADRFAQAVHVQIQDKKEGADPLVAIGKRMILDDEIEEMGGLFLNGGVEVITVEGLIDGTENAGQTCTAFLAEQFGGLADGGKFIAETINTLPGEQEIERDC